MFVPRGTGNDHSPANGPSGPQARRDEGLQCFESTARTPPMDFRREDSCCRSTFIDPFKMGRRSQMLAASLRAGLFDFLQQDPLGHTGSCSLDLRDLPTKPVRLRRVRIVQGSRANRLQDDRDGLGLLRGFSGIREQLFAGTRKGRWARSGQATRGQVKPWAGSGQTTWKRAPDVMRNSFNDWSYLSYEMPRETS